MPYLMKQRAAGALICSWPSKITTADSNRVSSDSPLGSFVAFLAEYTKVGKRSRDSIVAHLQRFAAWLDQRYQAPLLDAAARFAKM